VVYIYDIYTIYKMSVETRCMKYKIKKGVGLCNFLKPRAVTIHNRWLAKANFLKFINALYFLFYPCRVKKKRITHLSHGIFSFFCLYRREREN